MLIKSLVMIPFEASDLPTGASMGPIEVGYGKMDIVIPPPRSRLLLVAHLPLPPDAGLLIQGTSWCDEVDCWALTEESWHRQQPPLLTPLMLGLAWVAVVLIGCRLFACNDLEYFPPDHGCW